MATDRLKLVQGDTRPPVITSLTDDMTGGPLDVSDPGTTVRLKFRAEGATAAAIIAAIKLTGYDAKGDGTAISTTPPYDVAGKGGRVQFNWPVGALDGEPGNYEGEIEVTFADGTIQTVYELLKFKLREQF